ncbi:MAG: alpha/beta hydrolase [Rickettsiales bacterium]
MQTKSWKILKRVLFLLFTVYLGILLGLYVFQRSQVFHPAIDKKMPAEYGLNKFENLIITTSDNTKVQLWYKKAKPGYPTVVYFPGNAYSLGNRAHRFKEISEKGFGVIGVSYRGYGQSEGSPSEPGLYDDARAAMSYATTKLSIPSRQMILYGESLGTAVATFVATEYAVGGLILEAPPLSILARGQELYPYIPVSWLLKDTFPTIDRIGKIHTPLLIMHGDADRVVPVEHGRSLYKAAEKPKKIIIFKGIHHIDIPAERVAKEIDRFAEHFHLTE